MMIDLNAKDLAVIHAALLRQSVYVNEVFQSAIGLGGGVVQELSKALNAVDDARSKISRAIQVANGGSES